MNIALNHDGTYKKYEDISKIQKNLTDIKYLLIDNSTVLKGPTYTLVKAEDIKFNSLELVNIIIHLSYAAIDTPCCDETTLPISIDLSKGEKLFEKRYSVYPLIKQLFGFNVYKEEYLMTDNMINVDYLSLNMTNDSTNKTKVNSITLDSFDLEKDIKKTFRDIGLLTSVSKVLDDNHIILKDNKWYIDETIPEKFDYVAYNIQDIETLYLLSQKQFERLELIKELKIDIIDRTNYSSMYTFDDIGENPEDYSDDNLIYGKCVQSILKCCIYFSQILDLEHLIYNKTADLRILLSTTTMNYTLNISEKELQTTVLCLFKIIQKLLQMQQIR